MLLPIAVVIACLVAALLQLAALRSPDILETDTTRNARKLTIAGLVVAAIYMAHTLTQFGTVSTPFALAMGLVALGQILFGMHSILPNLRISLETH